MANDGTRCFKRGLAGWPAPLPLRHTSQCDAHDVLGNAQGRRHSRGDLPCSPTVTSISCQRAVCLQATGTRESLDTCQWVKTSAGFGSVPVNFLLCVDACAGLFISGIFPSRKLSDCSQSNSIEIYWTVCPMGHVVSSFLKAQTCKRQWSCTCVIKSEIWPSASEWGKKKSRLEGTDILLFLVANIAAINIFGKDRVRNKKKENP